MSESPEIVSTAAPAPKGRVKGLLGWGAAALVLLLVALVAAAIGDPSMRRHSGMDPEGRGWNGALALAEILGDQGVDVTVTRSYLDAIRQSDDSTALVFTSPHALTDEAITQLATASGYTVILDGGTFLLELLDLGTYTSAGGDAVEAGCDWLPFSRVGTVEPSYFYTPAEGVTGCFVDGEGDAAVLVDERGEGILLFLGARQLFTNENLAENGNAALALALLAQRERLIWYVPSYADTDREWEQDPTLGELSPPWLSPAILLLALAAAAAALWRGRRFGPLVAETLPVTVRASETMHGRARLVAKAADAAHAAAALRSGTLGRLAKRLALGEHAAASAVADAVADRLQVPRASLQQLLLGELPATDPELVGFARQLDELEQALETLVHTERKTP